MPADKDTWAVSQDSVANTAQTLTKAAAAGVRHKVEGISCDLQAAAAAADITVVLKFGGVRVWEEVIGSGAARGARVAKEFVPPLDAGVNVAVTVDIAAGGAGAITTGNVAGYSEVG